MYGVRIRNALDLRSGAGEEAGVRGAGEFSLGSSVDRVEGPGVCTRAQQRVGVGGWGGVEVWGGG